MNRLNVVGLIFLSLLVFGCGQDPMPKSGSLQVAPEPPKKEVVPPFSIDLPNSFDLQEGEEFKIQIKALVPEPGKADLRAFDLPQGATFDPATHTLTWVPSFNAANEDGELYKKYQVRFVLRSSEDKENSISKTVDLFVNDVPRDIRFEYSAPVMEFVEGTASTYKITATSDDFPAGPYTIYSTNLPSGAVLTPVVGSKNTYQLTYTPDARAVTYNDRKTPKGFQRLEKIELTAMGETGQSITTKAELTVYDKRLDPKVVAPSSVTIGLDGHFLYAAEDLNVEDYPTISLLKPVPFGRIELTTVDTTGKGTIPRTTVNFRWSQIPLEKVGTTQDLIITSCVKKSYFDKLCVDSPLKISITSEGIAAPVIDRKNYPLGTIRYAKVGVPISVPLRISAPNGTTLAKVEIEPAGMAGEVRWSSGTLYINPATDGLRQFNIHATSSSGIVKTEGFVFDAMPSAWSSVVVLGDSMMNPEMRATLNLFDSAQLVNPEFQRLEGRILALRQTLVVTTAALKNPGVVEQLEEASKSFRNIVVLSPLAKTLTSMSSFQGFGLESDGRLSEQTDAPPGLVEFQIAAGRTLTEPMKVVSLAGKASSESPDPLTLKATSASCTRLLSMKSRSSSHMYSTAFACTRSGGSVLLVSGVEWADFVTDPVDEKIARQWMSEVIKP